MIEHKLRPSQLFADRGNKVLKFVRLSLVAVLVAIAVTFATGAGAAPPGSASYIVVLNANAGPPSWVAAQLSSRFGGSVSYVYSHALNGFALSLPPQAAQALARDPRVASVEADGVVTADTTQSNATWGLDRVDQRALPLSGTFTYTRTGAGVKAYIIDTGIRFTHTQFGGRAIKGVDEVTANGTAADCNGHGTHVAGTVGGSTYGVAKGVTLVAVRVLNCNGSGTTSGVIAGVDWVAGNHAAGKPAVANMSLGGGASSALDTAVRNSIADGISYAIAAGNGNIFGVAQNACNTSPARVAEAMTVSATNNTDTKASWANYGSCVDWFAPGVSITSAWYTSNTATNTISGTSMATPHTAGVAALYLQGNPSASPATVRAALFNNSTKNVVKSPGSGSPNALLFTNY
jgi:subtilisin family serine protease